MPTHAWFQLGNLSVGLFDCLTISKCKLYYVSNVFCISFNVLVRYQARDFFSAVCETYYILCSSLPNSVTPHIIAVCKHFRCCQGLSPSVQFGSKKYDAWIPLAIYFAIHVRSTPPQVVQLITLQFMRNYFTNAIWYVVHCLPICLNAAGYLANIHTRGCNTRSKHCSMLH